MGDQRRDQQSQIAFLLEQKRKVQLKVRERFSRYGDEPAEIIENAALQANGLVRMLEKLGLPPSPHFDKQLDLLARFINSNGSEIFLRRVKAKKMGEDTMARLKKKMKRASSGDPLSGWVGPLFNEEGEYIGPERRSGKDRRVNPDRRQSVETITKNQRFGGDRRKNKGRRKTDPK